MKIMRRGAIEDHNSKQPSRADSLDDAEAGARPESSTGENQSETQQSRTGSITKERGNLTREEREAKYKEARERIFKGFEESEADDRSNWAESTKHSSRSSSRTGKNKGGGKRNRNNDDGFELRSQYAAYYQSSPQGFSAFGTTTPSYSPFATQHSTFTGNDMTAYPSRDMQMQTMLPQQMPFQANGAFAPPGSLYSEGPVDAMGQPIQAVAHASSVASTHSHTSSPLPTPGEYGISAYQPGSSGVLPPGVRQPSYPPQLPKGQWPPFAVQHQYLPDMSSNPATYHPGVEHLNGSSPSMGMPAVYPYGQLPNQIHQHTGFRINHQHPLPGSFNRRAFNPQTQPFVPGHRQAMGQSQPYGAQLPTGGNFPSPFQPTASVPPTFSMSVHGPPHNVAPHIAPAHPSQAGNLRFPNIASNPSGPVNVPQPDRRTQANEPARWHHPASLPPKPPNVQSQSPRYHTIPDQREAMYGGGPPVVVGSHIPTTSGPLPSRSPR